MAELTTTFRQWDKFFPKTFRSYFRDLALDLLYVKTQLLNSEKMFKKPRIQFLYIHHVFDDEIENFDNLLNILSKYHTFISHSDAVEKMLSRNIDKPYISISSDDGFKNNLSAAKIMSKYGIKGCFFVNPDTIGLKDFSKVKSFCNKRLHCPPTEFMNWNDIEYLIKNGHEIGSHTMGHINIAETNINIVEDNINKSYQILNKRIGDILHFAYPYGRFFHFTKQAFDLVFNAGFKSCATAERGCHISHDKILNYNQLLIRRDHVVCDWNINHILYFIINNSKNTIHKTNLFPAK
jgi:peptidoglycan/xylan/chitin deacetylase (PgdA/CDA1 family)